MALKIQLRRDIAANWTINNPLLLNGEIGIETDTLKFKIGNGAQRWNSLPNYAFKPGQPNGVATLNSDGKIPVSQLPDQMSLDAEVSTAIQTALSEISTSGVPEGTNLYFSNQRAVAAVDGLFDTVGSAANALEDAKADTTNKINDALVLASQDADAKATEAYLNSVADSEGYIINAINLLSTSDIEEGSRLYFNTSRVENIVGPLISETRGYVDQEVAGAISYVDSALASFDPAAAITSTSDVPEGSNLYFTNARAISATNPGRIAVLQSALSSVDDLRAEIQNDLTNYVLSSSINSAGGIAGLDSSSKLQESFIPDTILRAASPTITGDAHAENLNISGNLTVTGTTTTVNSTNLEVTDPLIYIGSGNVGNSSDLGIVGHFNNGTYQHSGIVRDASDGKWKLFSGVTTEPSSTIDFTSAIYDTLKLGSLEASSASIGSVTNVEIQRLAGVTSGIQSQFNNITSTYATTIALEDALADAKAYTDSAANGLTSSLDLYALTADRNMAGGYAGLDIDGKILLSAIPSSITLAITDAANLAATNINGTYINGNSSTSLNKITYGTNATPPSSGNSAGDIYIQY
jgi:predicted RecA/RadA family phage recombinase